MRLFLIFIGLWLSAGLQAQKLESHLREQNATEGHVLLHISDDVLAAMSSSSQEEKEAVEEKSEDDLRKEARAYMEGEKRKVAGYRVQVWAGDGTRQSKVKAEQVKSQMHHLFPYYPVYSHYESPRWKCKLGNFTSREEADKVLEEVKARGYSKAMVVYDQILVVR